jgi:hypothetical protein
VIWIFDVKNPVESSFHGVALPLLMVNDADVAALPAAAIQVAGSGLGTSTAPSFPDCAWIEMSDVPTKSKLMSP